MSHDSVDGVWHMADKVSLDSFERCETCQAPILSVLRKYIAM